MSEVIIQKETKPVFCKNCKTLTTSTSICPICSGSFCNACAKFDTRLNGNSIICPHCNNPLSLPD